MLRNALFYDGVTLMFPNTRLQEHVGTEPNFSLLL